MNEEWIKIIQIFGILTIIAIFYFIMQLILFIGEKRNGITKKKDNRTKLSNKNPKGITRIHNGRTKDNQRGGN